MRPLRRLPLVIVILAATVVAQPAEPAKQLKKLDAFSQIDWDEAMGDGTFAPAKKGAQTSARRRRARAPRSC